MLSGKERRRRAAAQISSQPIVRQAFGREDDDDSSTQRLNDESRSTLKTKPNVEPERIYHRAFFAINNTTVEVELEENILRWSNVSGNSTLSEETHSKRLSQRENNDSIHLNQVYAITPISLPGQWSANVNENVAGSVIATANSIAGLANSIPAGSLRGFQLHSFQSSIDHIVQEVLIIFQSNSSALIEDWFKLLAERISLLRPSRNIMVMCNPYAGARHSRNDYRTKIGPILERAKYKINYLEIDDYCSADDVLNSFEGDFDAIDGLVILGGDGSVINVINALIRYLARANRTTLEMENELPPLPFPLCIVPEGTTNVICHSYQGNTDICTGVLHLLFDQRMKIDMSAVFDLDSNLVTANFYAAAGFPANALKYFSRYCLHSPKTIVKKSFAKAASNKNLKPMQIDIRYVPAGNDGTTSNPCYRGCPSCAPENSPEADDQVTAFDNSHVQGLIKKKNVPLETTTSKTRRFHSIENGKNWRILQEEYLQVAVLTNACLWSFAPSGLSKYGHLSDGVLELILVQSTSRKEFLRYVKRNGNAKNPYDLPFTNLIRVKEIEIELRLPAESFLDETMNDENVDSSLSDEMSNSDNESTIQARHTPRPPSAPRSEDVRHHRRRHRVSETTSSKNPSENDVQTPPAVDPMGSTTSLRRSGFFQSFKSKLPLPRPFSARSKSKTMTNLRPARSLLNILPDGNSSSRNVGRRPSVISRSSSVDNGKLATMKENYRRKKQPCLWNLDFTPYNSTVIRIKCFHRYLPVFGVGLDPTVRPREINYSCFGRLR